MSDIAATGVPTSGVKAMAGGTGNEIYLATDKEVFVVSGGNVTSLAKGFGQINGLCVDPLDGAVLVLDAASLQVVDPKTGLWTTLVSGGPSGTDGNLPSASLQVPVTGITMAEPGTVLLTQLDRVRRLKRGAL
jgi:hypothetical protein